MKIAVLMVGLFGLVLAKPVFAQKGELSYARTEFDKYKGLYGQKRFAAMATTALNQAKISIDKASVNVTTSALPQTYALKGAVYAALAYRDTVSGTSASSFGTAEVALKKAQLADKNGESSTMINDAYQTLIAIKFHQGVNNYQAGKYQAAYQDFNFYHTVRPYDTAALYYTGLSAARAGMYNEALSNYNQLISTNFSKNAAVYNDIALVYLSEKDTATAFKTVKDGAVKYPDDLSLADEMISLGLQLGKADELIGKTAAAISADPRNKVNYYHAGLCYTHVKDFGKAEEAYKKAIEIDPNYFDAIFNLGHSLMRPGIELYNAAQKLKTEDRKRYDEDMKRAAAYGEIANPFLLKAADLRPDSYDALYDLKLYYAIKNDAFNAGLIQKKLNRLKPPR